MLSILPALVMALAPPASPGFTVGIELPSQVPVPLPVERALKDLGIGYAGFYVANTPAWEPPEAGTTEAMVALCRRLGLKFTLDCHHRDPSAASIRAAAAEPGFLGVAGAPAVVSTEVWPSLLHAAARVGMTPCPKVCKEFYSPVSLAVGMGAALQYGRPLWVDVDMWYFALVPGHPADEVRANLQLAYWMGADLVYLEGSGYNLMPAGKQGVPFSLMTQVDAERYQLTPHGEMLKEFCTKYLPANPRPYTFRDVRPTMAIIRFDDTDVGQKSWGADRLYGTTRLKPDRDTAAWLGLWNVLTHGRTGADGIAYFKASIKHTGDDQRYHQSVTPSYLTEPASAEHRFFVPLNGAVVFDERVEYDRLRGIPLLFLTGKSVSPATLAAIRRCVSEGALCVAWAPLARSSGLTPPAGHSAVRRLGKGRLILTDDFQSPATVTHYRRFLGKPDEIRYTFGARSVALKRVTDNTVDVRVSPAR
ncbi:MAG: hypothetical protein NT029_11765 [Armatimonadetes bacterium]|nr:hypothetical protein [Armatimonadota bacterium]